MTTTTTWQPTFECQTARAVREALAERGIVGPAADLVVRGGARERHIQRVYTAVRVAVAWAERVLYGVALPETIPATEPEWEYWEYVEPKARLAAWAILDSARYGTGKPGSWGTSQRPMPLATLGKGRRWASDGGAWSAAMGAAANILADKCGARWAVVDGALCAEGEMPVSVVEVIGIPAACAVAGWHVLHTTGDVQVSWAECYNALALVPA